MEHEPHGAYSCGLAGAGRGEPELAYCRNKTKILAGDGGLNGMGEWVPGWEVGIVASTPGCTGKDTFCVFCVFNGQS